MNDINFSTIRSARSGVIEMRVVIEILRGAEARGFFFSFDAILLSDRVSGIEPLRHSQVSDVRMSLPFFQVPPSLFHVSHFPTRETEKKRST